MTPRNEVAESSDSFMLFACVAMVGALLWLREADIIRLVCTLLYYLWEMIFPYVDFPRTHYAVGEKINLLVHTVNNADNTTWSQFFDVLNETSGLFIIPLFMAGVMGFYMTITHPMNKTRRPININTLPRIMSAFSSAIIPALEYGDPITQLLNVDPEEHRRALAPDEFARQHGLVVNRRLNRVKADEVFQLQLGNIVTSFAEYNEHERALFAIFGLQHFLNKRKQAERLLDDLNRSCLASRCRSHRKPGYPDLSLASKAFSRVSATPQAKAWLVQHRYVRTAITDLYNHDLHLPTARFRWLKGLDRTLWYALSSTGRPCAFVEGAAVVTAAQWERLATKYQVLLPETADLVSYAVDGLDDDLISIGVVIDDTPTQYASADDDPEGDEEDDEDETESNSAPQPDTAKKDTQPRKSTWVKAPSLRMK